jgi:eukaryotic-like serine/threonine-protein kinase
LALEGTQLGRYRLKRLLGSGGMGEVYLADDSTLNRQLAVKVIRADPSPYPNSDTVQAAAKLFQREARAIAMLDHPHILPLYDYGEERGGGGELTYLVMPYRPEGTLNDWLRQRASGPLAPGEVVQLIQQAASALQYAHNHQLIHQDVKPSNFLMRATGEDAQNAGLADIQLADFGIARLITSTSANTHGSRGTPLYMAPEQWTGNAVQASDQYALAVMAYELLTGTLPFKGGLAQVMYAHMHTPPAPPSSLNPRLSRAFDYVLLRALAKDPQERYASISEFARALQHAATSSSDAQTMEQGAQTSMGRNQEEMPRATLVISVAEARSGTGRMVTLPGGRQAPVQIPPGVVDGQAIRIDQQSGQPVDANAKGVLVLTIAVSNEERPRMSSAPEETYISRANVTQVARPRKAGRGRAVVLIVLAMIVVVAGGLGIFYFTKSNTAIMTQRNTPGSVVNTGNVNDNPYPPHSGTLVLNDTLQDGTHSSWREESDTFGACQFIQGAYHVTMSLQGLEYCFSRSVSVNDFAYQVQVVMLKGSSAGLLVRGNPDAKSFYYCYIGPDGSYGINVYSNKSDGPTARLSAGISKAIHQGGGQSNTVAVVARGTTLELYVNMQLVSSVTTNTYSGGNVGTAAYSLLATDGSGSTEAVFSNAKVWKL